MFYIIILLLGTFLFTFVWKRPKFVEDEESEMGNSSGDGDGDNVYHICGSDGKPSNDVIYTRKD